MQSSDFGAKDLRSSKLGFNESQRPEDQDT